MATLPLKTFHKEQCSVIHFPWTKWLCQNAIYHSEIRPECGDKCFTRPAVRLVSEVCSCCWWKKTWPMCCFDNAAIAAVESLIRSDRHVSMCSNKFGRYVAK